jgi:MFS transporter, DHA1 family, quinolone resistance protein
MNQSVKQIKSAYFSVTALTWLSVAIPLPIFVLFMQARGLDLFQVGAVMGAYSLVIVILELPTGGLADAIGRKKVSLLAQGINLVSAIVLLFSFSFAGFLLAMILLGLGRALSSGALDAWFVDSLQTADPDIDLQPPLAQAGTVTLLALGLGTLLGGFLPELFSGLAAKETALLTPLSTTVIISALLKLILIGVTAGVVKETPRENQGAGSWRKGFAEVPQIIRESIAFSCNSSILLLLMGATLVGGFILAGVETFWQPRFDVILGDGSGSSWVFGLIMAISFLAGVGGNLLSIPLGRFLRRRYAWAALLARSGQSVGLILLATQGAIIPAAVGFWFFYLNMGVLNSPHETLINEEIPASRRSAMLSIQSLSSYIGGFLGSVLLGFIAQNQSISSAWIVAGGVSMVSLLFYMRVAALLQKRGRSNEQNIPVWEQITETDPG